MRETDLELRRFVAQCAGFTVHSEHDLDLRQRRYVLTTPQGEWHWRDWEWQCWDLAWSIMQVQAGTQWKEHVSP